MVLPPDAYSLLPAPDAFPQSSIFRHLLRFIVDIGIHYCFAPRNRNMITTVCGPRGTVNGYHYADSPGMNVERASVY